MEPVFDLRVYFLSLTQPREKKKINPKFIEQSLSLRFLHFALFGFTVCSLLLSRPHLVLAPAPTHHLTFGGLVLFTHRTRIARMRALRLSPPSPSSVPSTIVTKLHDDLPVCKNGLPPRKRSIRSIDAAPSDSRQTLCDTYIQVCTMLDKIHQNTNRIGRPPYRTTGQDRVQRSGAGKYHYFRVQQQFTSIFTKTNSTPSLAS